MSEHLPGLSKREVLEGMTPDSLVDLILSTGEKIGAMESEMNLASQVLEGYGTTVERELAKRERETNGKT